MVRSCPRYNGGGDDEQRLSPHRHLDATSSSSRRLRELDWSIAIDDRLTVRCQRMYNWNGSFANRVAKGYRQFLELKLALKDWDEKKIAPSRWIDEMWNAHILDTRKYMSDCMRLFDGQIIHHDPDEVSDKLDNFRIVERTLIALESRYGEVDSTVWDFGTHTTSIAGSTLTPSTNTPEVTARPPERPTSTLSSKKPNSFRPSPRTSMMPPTASVAEHTFEPEHPLVLILKVRDHVTRDLMYFKLRRMQPLSVLFARYAQRKGLSRAHFQFLFKGTTLDENDTAMDQDMVEDDEIEAVQLNEDGLHVVTKALW